MLYILRHFEKTAVHLDSTILVVSGVVVFLLGLVIWLAGTAFRKFLAIIAGAVVGCIIGLFVAGRNIVSATVSAGLAAMLAAMFGKLFITALAALLAAVIGFVLLAGSHLQEDPGTIPTALQNAQNAADTLGPGQTIEVIKLYVATLFAQARYISSQMTALKPAIITGIVAAVLITGFFFGDLIGAAAAATMGTVFVFAGMILLLLYKGSESVSHISSRQTLYVTVFAAMTAFGTILQLLFCRCPVKNKMPTVKKEMNNQKGARETAFGWRGS
jgi:hypothetical protein